MQAHEQTDQLAVNELVNTLSIAQRDLCAGIQVTSCDLGEARRLQINALAEPRFLQECAGASCGVRVVYAGTRQIYGVPEFLPVDESHLISPEDFNGIHK